MGERAGRQRVERIKTVESRGSRERKVRGQRCPRKSGGRGTTEISESEETVKILKRQETP